MLFSCKACNAALQKDDIDFQTGIASCSHCQAVMSFAKEMGLDPRPAPPAAPPVQPARPWAAKPRSIQVSNTAMALEFTRRWFNGTFIFLLFFCIFWDGFLIFWYTMRPNTGSGMDLIFFLFPLIHVAVGVALTYYTLAGFVNRTKIRVDDNQLSIRHEPLPWRGTKSLAIREIKQLYCERKITHTKNGTSITYPLNAMLKSAENQQLL